MATTKIFIDEYHPRKKDGKCAVSIRITHEGKKKYYPTPYVLSVDEFDSLFNNETRKNKEIKFTLQAFEIKANGIIQKLNPFTWESFEKQYLSNQAARDTIKQGFEDFINIKTQSDKLGTADSYTCAMSSLNKFFPDATYADITPNKLKEYEKWMLSNGKSITTVGIYLRPLKAVFNNAIREGLIENSMMPFGRGKYITPKGNNKKKALLLSDIKKIFEYEAISGSSEEMAKDLWIFMYLTNGINIKDLCLLKYGNIQDNMISFVREKTKNTSMTPKIIKASVNETTNLIIEKWGNTNKSTDNFIFPILEEGLTSIRKRQLIKQFNRVVNNYTKRIAENLKLPITLTTYTARHSFATALKRAGISMEMISEMLGHESYDTTINYLGGFEDISIIEAAKKLTNF